MGGGEIVILFSDLTCPPGLSCSLQAQRLTVDKSDQSLLQNACKLSSKPDLLLLPAKNMM